MKSIPQIRMLNSDDAHAFIEHNVRNELNSVSGPRFLAFSSGDAAPFDARVQATKRKWAIPTDKQGWTQSWGAIIQESAGKEKIIGSIDLATSRLIPSQRHRVILGIGIEAEFRHLGLGKELMRTAIVWAKQQQFIDWIDLGVFAHNASARRLYERFQFMETGRTVDCFRVDGYSLDDIQMSLHLRQFDV